MKPADYSPCRLLRDHQGLPTVALSSNPVWRSVNVSHLISRRARGTPSLLCFNVPPQLLSQYVGAIMMFLVSKVQQLFCWSTLVYSYYLISCPTSQLPSALQRSVNLILPPWQQQSARLHSQQYLDINPVKRSYSEEDAALKTAVYPHLYQN